MPRDPFQIGAVSIEPGRRAIVPLPVSQMPDHSPAQMAVEVVHGRRPGPTLFVSAAIHGDEVIGVDIARRLLRAPALGSLRGTLLVVPIVNAFGFLNRSRYLPDRRDLNRSFPGSPGGSLASRLADLFMREIAGRSDFGIDLHSAGLNRTNLPQVRISPARQETVDAARAFGAPVILRAPLRDGSLRGAAQAAFDLDILLFEAGEALRFDEVSARIGVAGILRVMRHLGMIPRAPAARTPEPLLARSSSWVRAPAGGLLRGFREVGARVEGGQTLAAVSDPFGADETELTAPESGLVIGRAVLPVVNEGDAVYHLATVPGDRGALLDDFNLALGRDPLFDEDEIL